MAIILFLNNPRAETTLRRLELRLFHNVRRIMSKGITFEQRTDSGIPHFAPDVSQKINKNNDITIN